MYNEMGCRICVDTLCFIMTADTKQKVQLGLFILFLVVTARTGYIFYQRYQDRVATDKKKQEMAVGYSNPDYYVNPKKLYPYDIKSAKQLTQQIYL